MLILLLAELWLLVKRLVLAQEGIEWVGRFCGTQIHGGGDDIRRWAG